MSVNKRLIYWRLLYMFRTISVTKYCGARSECVRLPGCYREGLSQVHSSILSYYTSTYISHCIALALAAFCCGICTVASQISTVGWFVHQSPSKWHIISNVKIRLFNTSADTLYLYFETINLKNVTTHHRVKTSMRREKELNVNYSAGDINA